MSSRNKSNVKKLFEFWCEVTRAHGVDRSSRTGAAAPAGVIVESFPESFRDEKTIADIPAFAFPCDFSCDSVQSYSFVLTTDDSKWRFGFCRHDPKTDSAMVIITYLPWHDTFLRLLTVLAELRRSDNGDFRTFLTEAFNRGVPDPGGKLEIFYNGGQNYFVFERPLQFQLPSIPENHNLNLYYNFVDPKNMIAVFAAMLAERRIIFTSRRLDRLSSCIQAANAFLYPMVWQHIFIPVLPMKLKDYLSAPMPYLIGVPEMVLETMTPDELGEVVILNCDTKIFESPFDDVHDMPAEIVSQLKKHLSHSSEHIGDRVSKIFLCVLVQLIGGYRDAVEFRETGKKFNRDKFIETRPSHLRPFLAKMMDLQIFQQFIDERIDMLNTGLGFSDEFELETVRYAEKMKKRGRNYAFLKNVKDKTNPAVKSAVKSVKEGSRGVKTAYKDLKSKFRDITPPSNNTHFRSHLSSNSQHDRIDGYIGGKSSGGGHHSAPSSPIFNKRGHHLHHHLNHSQHPTAGGFQYASPEEINGAAHAIRKAPALAMSSSSTHIQPNGYASYAPGPAHHNTHLASSPTISPASSLCSSEMNLSQELQNHPLFKSPVVDRSSLRSLQPQHLQLPHPPGSLHSVSSSFASQEDTMNDLISLDDSTNTSFDLEDFDPLNQNARPLPLSGSGGKRSTTLPSGTSPALMTPSGSVNNPLYPYFTPQHNRPPLLPPTTKPPPPPTDIPSYDDDFELLRKYGLDQFTLNSSTAATASPGDAFHNNHRITSNSNMMQSTTTGSASMNNWTTFD